MTTQHGGDALVSPPKGSTRSGQAHDQMRADILAGRLMPGQKLPFADLVRQYECSIGALREALQRLAAQGLVTSEVQQGFRVTAVSKDDLLDLTTARVEIEVLAFRYAVKHGDVAWEANAVAALHLLERADQFDPTDPQRLSEDWASAHAKFHEALLVGCPNHRILAAASSLRDSAELYRRWSVPLSGDRERDIAGEHRAILQAAVAREVDTAAEILAAHISRTTEMLLVALDNVPPQ